MECTEEQSDNAKPQSANKNGKKADSGSSSSFFTWFIVLALLGVWTSVAMVYFDLVDYQGVIEKAKGLQINLSEALQGKLVAYDTDGDGDFDVEDAKVLLANKSREHEEQKRSRDRVQPELPVPRFKRRERKKAGTRGTKYLAAMRAASLGLEETPGDTVRRQAKKETSPSKNVGWKLREALKQQLAIIHERVEAKKLAKLALAEVRQLLAKEEEQKELELGRKEIIARAKEKVVSRLKKEEEKMEKEDLEKTVGKLRKDKAKQPNEKREVKSKDEKERDKKLKKEGEKKEKSEKKLVGEGRKTQEENKGRGKESVKGKKKEKQS
ncbi:aspartyl/asparaginyl beta-hydroxylase-like isoform X2 [Anabas testudineus]|uniref:Aspartyl beta-hydroxylase/Triadin domain-containing protein n=1 Tax=Anabas testudineus TaxID=64144 RepID=A0AAQ6I9T0_ANATE|nr:aspartyl/asparaginyl beta-hydroxylase-like isoform X2 [Anabas testudineus]